MPGNKPDALLNYVRALYAPEDGLLSYIRTHLEQDDWPIQIFPEEGKLLQLLIRMANIKTIVEIGTLGGYSAIWMARALPEDGTLYTLERDNGRFQMAQTNIQASDVAHKIEIRHGDARQTLQNLSPKAPFDMIFIDADKIHYPDYLDWAENHIHAGGLIVADNTLLFDAVHLDKAPPDSRLRPTTMAKMKDFNQRLADPDKYVSVLLPTDQGLSIAIKLF